MYKYTYDCTENGEPCEQDKCQICCPHDEFDHYICLDCGYEKDPGGDIDDAYERYRDGD